MAYLKKKKVGWWVGWLYYGMSTLVGYSMLNPVYIYIYILTNLLSTSMVTRKKEKKNARI